MKRTVAEIDKHYRSVEVDPWGVDWRGTMAVRNRFYARIVADALNRVETQEESVRLLDVGAGSGILSEHLWNVARHVRPVGRYLAVDVSPVAVSRAKALHPRSRIEYQVVDQDFSQLEGRQFDLILAFEILPYLDREERRKLFSRLRQLSHPGTLIVMSSNVRLGSEDKYYVAGEQLQSEISQEFDSLSSHDFYTAVYVDNVEQRLLAWQHRRYVGALIRWTLSRSLPPAAVNGLIAHLATETWPRQRNRVYVLR